MSLDRAPSSPSSVLESRGPRVFLSALWRRCKRAKRAKGFQGEDARGPQVNGQNHGPHVGVSTRVLAPLLSIGSVSQCREGQRPILYSTESSENTENLRTLFSSTYTATRSCKQAILLIYPDAVLENSKGRRIQP